MDPLNKHVAVSPKGTPNIETMAQKYPPLIAWTVTAAPALAGNSSGPSGGDAVHGQRNSPGSSGVAGIHTAAGSGVYGQSTGGDGVHGVSSGLDMSGVCGIHSSNGNGVYGRSAGHAGFFEGDVAITGTLTVQGDVVLPLIVTGGGDCAEFFGVSSGDALSPGDVTVLTGDGTIRKSDRRCDPRVAGVVAGAGDYQPGVLLDSSVARDASRVPISLIGKVFCRVDASSRPIQIGDLLTTADTPGHAMAVGTDMRTDGTVIGKAMGALASGLGLIPILAMLR